MARAGNLYIDIAMNVAQIQKDVKKASDSLSAFGAQAQKLGTILSTAFKFTAITAGAVGVYKSINGLTSSLKELADAGERAGDITTGFEALGGSAQSIEEARSRTMGLIDSFELMRSASKGLAAEIPNFGQQFANIADLGARFADTMGIDTVDGINKLVEALKSAKGTALEQFGLTIDLNKAYADYAATLGTTADKLTETEKKHAKQAQAVAQVEAAMKRLAPVGDSVSTAGDAVATAWGEAEKAFARTFNENEQVTQALRDLEAQIKNTDISQLAKDFGDLATVLANIASVSVPYVIDTLEDLGRTVRLVGEAIREISSGEGYNFEHAVDVLKAKDSLAAQLASRDVAGRSADVFNTAAARSMAAINSKSGTGDLSLAEVNKLIGEVTSSIDKAAKSGVSLTGSLALPELLTDLTGIKKKLEEAGEAAGDRGLGGSAKKAKDELKQLAESVAKLGEQQWEKGISKQIEDAIGNLDTASFDKLSAEFEKHTAEGIRKGLDEAVSKGVISAEKADALAATGAKQAGERYHEEMSKAIDKNAEEQAKAIKENADLLKKEFEDAYRELIDFWRQAFEDVFSGNGFDISGWMKKIASGFAAELMTALTGAGGLGGLMNPGNLGGELAQIILGGGGGLASVFGGGTTGSGLGGLVSGALGGTALGSFFGGGGAATIQGPLTQAGQAAYAGGMGRDAAMSIGAAPTVMGVASSAGAAFGYASLLDSLSKIGKGAKSNYTAGTTAAGAGIGAVVGSVIPVLGTAIGAGLGAAFGNVFGKFSAKVFGIGGPTNAETLARKAAANAIETIFDQVSKEGGVRFIDEHGHMQLTTDITDQPFDHFNKFDRQRDFYDKYGQQNANAYQAIGTSIADQVGMGDQAEQLGPMLAESFKGSIEGLKAFVQTMGLTQQQVQDQLLKRGKEGAESWAEIVGEIHASALAFQEGLSGKGQFGQAMQNLFKTAGRGQIALNQLKNIAIEAGEVGIKSVAQLEAQRQAIIASGTISAEEFDSVIAALKEHGISNLGDLQKAGDLPLAEIVASVDAQLKKHGKTWEEVGEGVKEFKQDIEDINGKTVDITFNVGADISETAQKLIDEGIIKDVSDFTKKTGGGDEGESDDLGAVNDANTQSTKSLSRHALRRATDGGSYRATRGVQLNIDARGAGNGVAQEIVAALGSIEDRIQTNTMGAVMKLIDRARI